MINTNIIINDTFCTKCYKNAIEKNEQITSTDTSIELQDNYFLNILSISGNKITVIIQNGNCVIIRIILSGVQTSILIPSNCSHILTLTATA